MLAEVTVTMQKLELKRGRHVSKEGELRVLTGEYRRLVRLAPIKAQAGCLLTRLNQAGEGFRAADQRRSKVVWGSRRLGACYRPGPGDYLGAGW